MTTLRRNVSILFLSGLLILLTIVAANQIAVARQRLLERTRQQSGPRPAVPAVSAAERDRAITTLEAINTGVQQTEATILAVDISDVEEHADFLRQPDTGIFRLLPREIYDYGDSRRKLSMVGGGAYYSFDCQTHRYGYHTSLGLERNEFDAVFAGYDMGLFALLGDVDLAELSADDPRVLPLAQLVTPDMSLKQRLDILGRMRHGWASESAFGSRARVKLHTTHVLRTIHDSPDGSDSLVAFRAVRRDRDRSLIILWKMLKRFPLLPEDAEESQGGCL